MNQEAIEKRRVAQRRFEMAFCGLLAQLDAQTYSDVQVDLRGLASAIMMGRVYICAPLTRRLQFLAFLEVECGHAATLQPAEVTHFRRGAKAGLN